MWHLTVKNVLAQGNNFRILPGLCPCGVLENGLTTGIGLDSKQLGAETDEAAASGNPLGIH